MSTKEEDKMLGKESNNLNMNNYSKYSNIITG